MTYTIAVANLKGGVAKTTTTTSLAGALVELGYEVLAADLDAQANLTSAFGINPRSVRQSAVDVFFNWVPLSAASQGTDTPGLDIVPSHPDMTLAERFLPVRSNYETILRRSVDQTTRYDFILLDCPPFLGAVTLNALIAADLLVIPTVPEIFSWESLQKTVRYAEKITSSSNPNLQYRILICMLDARLRVHREITQQYNQRFSGEMFRNLIQVDTKLRESAVAGTPVTKYSPKTRSARQYLALAEEISSYVPAEFSRTLSPQNLDLEV